jgi:hypothetical protein
MWKILLLPVTIKADSHSVMTASADHFITRFEGLYSLHYTYGFCMHYDMT